MMSNDGVLITIAIFLVLALLGFWVSHKENQEKKVIPEKQEILPKAENLEAIIDIHVPAAMKVPSTELEDNHIDLREVSLFTVQNSFGQELIFEKPDVSSDSIQYREIKVASGTNIAAGSIKVMAPIAQQMYSAAELAKMAPNGLFTSTVNSQTLSHFISDGTYTTMIHGPNGVVSHAGFKAIPGLSGINPVMAINVGMQAMAAVSGQYYLQVINRQLNTIGKKLDDLSTYFEDKDVGIIAHVKNRLEEISRHQVVDNNDIQEIRSMANDVGCIYEAYNARYNRQKMECFNYHPRGKGSQKILNDYHGVLDDFKKTALLCSAAYQVTLQARLTLIAVTLRIDPLSPTLEDIKQDALNQFKNPFDEELVSNPNEAFSSIISNAKDFLNRKDLFESVAKVMPLTDNRKKERELLSPFKKDVKYLSQFADSMMNLSAAQEVVDGMTRQKKILVLPGKDEQAGRIFISA